MSGAHHFFNLQRTLNNTFFILPKSFQCVDFVIFRVMQKFHWTLILLSRLAMIVLRNIDKLSFVHIELFQMYFQMPYIVIITYGDLEFHIEVDMRH